MKTSLILLAGGVGQRMGASLPKQYLALQGKPIALHSIDIFNGMTQIHELVVVCHPDYRCHFANYPRVRFADAGLRRQDSVFNGFQQIAPESEFVCIHDSARPLITSPLVERVLLAASEYGAAAAGVPLKFTIKETDNTGKVKQTPDRSGYWEVQTPQIIRRDLLQAGFKHAQLHDLTVTDDLSLVEQIGHPVKMVEGCYRNLKITTPDDLWIAERYAQL